MSSLYYGYFYLFAIILKITLVFCRELNGFSMEKDRYGVYYTDYNKEWVIPLLITTLSFMLPH
jgi:hypothetical protein